MRTEIWKTAVIDGVTYENYQVSNWGRVKSLNYRRTGREELLEPRKTTDCYLKVEIWKDGKRKICFIHRLVAEAFIPNPLNLHQVNHKSEDKQDNRVENLEWCDHKYNMNYGTRNERITKANTNGKMSKKVLQFTLDCRFVREWESTMECGRNGFHQGHVSACCNGKLKSHKGFRWRYE